MKISFFNIKGLIDKEIERCCTQIKQDLESRNVLAYVRNEENWTAVKAKWVVEVMSAQREESDDYGIVVDLTFYESLEKIIYEVDIIKANGPVYSSKKMEMFKNEDWINSQGILDLVNYMHSIPSYVTILYMADYA